MDRVLDRLWIGDMRDLDPEGPPLRQLGFVAALDLRDGSHSPPLVDEVHRLRNRDGDPWSHAEILLALDFVAQQIRRGRVLVACAAGMSRSASMVIGYLVRIGYDAPTAHAAVRAARPRIAPAEAMLASVLGALRGETK